MDKKQQEIFDLIDTAYKDPKIKQNPEISSFLLTYATELENNVEVKLVCIRISRKITYYLLAHHYVAPQALTTLYQGIAANAEKYWGLIYLY
ncbi:bacteriocin immunity protein [Pediococcus cellicola]|uniref:Prebacteriocin n=1 Tax=Pediococcus cellicola TaxID=319652 RepID=A0A0R2IYX0_9LACO|nr:bacteriocin immunity protein [Pediococcus cellicola]KRN67028.1 hypothetical protein IV80_GL001118 [Pediococcus cellicola]GEL15038.1 hypothetical protein PCE01_08400 [Pediococcus cellicola]